MSTKHDPDFTAFPANVTAEVRVAQLQELCHALYVGVFGRCKRGDLSALAERVHAASGGRPFGRINLPWTEAD